MANRDVLIGGLFLLVQEDDKGIVAVLPKCEGHPPLLRTYDKKHDNRLKQNKLDDLQNLPPETRNISIQNTIVTISRLGGGSHTRSGSDDPKEKLLCLGVAGGTLRSGVDKVTNGKLHDDVSCLVRIDQGVLDTENNNGAEYYLKDPAGQYTRVPLDWGVRLSRPGPPEQFLIEVRTPMNVLLHSIPIPSGIALITNLCADTYEEKTAHALQQRSVTPAQAGIASVLFLVPDFEAILRLLDFANGAPSLYVLDPRQLLSADTVFCPPGGYP